MTAAKASRAVPLKRTTKFIYRSKKKMTQSNQTMTVKRKTQKWRKPKESWQNSKTKVVKKKAVRPMIMSILTKTKTISINYIMMKRKIKTKCHLAASQASDKKEERSKI